jgi:hypothetical protein
MLLSLQVKQREVKYIREVESFYKASVPEGKQNGGKAVVYKYVWCFLASRIITASNCTHTMM